MASRRQSGSVRRLPSGRWQARIRDPLTNELLSIGIFRTKAGADQAVALAVADQTRGSWVDPRRSRVTLSDYATFWLRTRPKPLSPRTLELYEGLLRLHVLPVLGGVELGRLSTSGVRSWHSELVSGKTGVITAAKAYRLLRAILATAVEDELIAKNPCTIRGAGEEHSPERSVASVAEVYALAEAVEPRFGPSS